MPKGAKQLERLCWWCGSRLVEGSVNKVLEPGGNEVQVHAQCVESVASYCREPRSAHVNFTGGWDGFKYYNRD